MTTIKHTSGPWEVHDDANSYFFGKKVVAKNDDCVAFTDEANAMLISAAPDLLQVALAGFALLRTIPDYADGEVVQMHREAIAKATGQEVKL